MHPWKSSLHRTTAVLAGTLLGLAGAVAFAAPASAHLPIIEATSTCVASDGSWTVSWKLSSEDLGAKVAEVELTPNDSELTPNDSTITGIAVNNMVPKWGTGELTGVQTLPATAKRAVLKVTLSWDRPDRNVVVTDNGQLDKPTLVCPPPPASPSPSPSVSSEPTSPPIKEPRVVYSMGCDEFSIGVENPANGKPETVTFTPSVGEPKTITAAPGESPTVDFPTPEELTVEAVPHSAPDYANTITYRSSDYCGRVGLRGAVGGFRWENSTLTERGKPGDLTGGASVGSVSASPSPSPWSVTAGATDGTAGGGALPVTGVAIGGVVGGAALLLAAGGVLFVLTRRRKMKFTA